MSDPSAEGAENLAASAVDDFLREAAAGRYGRDQIKTLIELAADPATSRTGLRALFPDLIERLNDSFDPECCSYHDRIMAQVIDSYRRRPEGALLDAALASFDLDDESDLLARKRSLTALPVFSGGVRRIIVLSRVTIGADVAVTSVVINRLKAVAPEAELVWIGPRKLAELYGGDRRIRMRALDYDRGGRVIDRLLIWLRLRQAVDEEMSGLPAEEVSIVDPDSRLTQLGMLPLAPGDGNYHFFESRSYRAEGRKRLGHLAARWSEERFPGQPSGSHPFLALPSETTAFAAEIGRRLRSGQSGNGRPIVCLSLGVGGNDLKRVSTEFERELLSALARNAVLILDRGGTPEESASIERLVEPLRREGKRIVEGREGAPIAADCDGADLFIWQGGIGSFAGLIAASDEYLGYDSSGQHLAAALGVPSLTVFVNNSTPLFARRWRPSGPGPIRVLELTREDASARSGADLVAEVLELQKGRENAEDAE